MNEPITEDEYKHIFHHSPSAVLIVDIDAPVWTIIDVNNSYLSATNSTREALIGQSVFKVFPANPSDDMSKNIEKTIDSFQQAISSGKPHTMNDYRYDIPIRNTGRFEERYWTTTNTPVRDNNGKVKYLIHSPTDVTELHKLREREQAGVKALEMQREQLYSFFMQAPVGIGIFQGPDYIVDLVNPYLAKLYGKSTEEMLGKPVFDVLTHAKGQGFEELLDKVRLTGEPFQGQALPVPLYRNGVLENVYVNFIYEPFRDVNDGSITGIIAVAEEVTDQIKAKKQLEEAEERARLAIDAVGLGTYDVNLETGEAITSPLFARIFGFEASVPWNEYIKAIHPDDLATRAKAHEEAYKTGRLFYEARLIWQDGTIHWCRFEGKFYFSNGKAIRMLGTALDVTEQKESQEQQQKLIQLIADNEQFLKDITSAIPTGLWTSDEQGNISYVNQTWIDWTGEPFESHLKDGWLNSVVKEDRKRTRDAFKRNLIERHSDEVEFRIQHVDGSVHWCVGTGKPQYKQDGSFSGYVGAWIDITDQKQLQKQKDDFIGIASHELKTPVTSIKAYIQVLERMLLTRGDTKEAAMVSKMDAQVNRLTTLIGDLLDVTKITAGKLQFNDQHFDFDPLVDEVLEDLQPVMHKHKLIKSGVSTAVVYGDKERIGQVITNLVTNAIKYSPKADRVLINTELTNNEVVLSVQDFGIGISRNNLEKIFEQFYRVSGDHQYTFPGLGLGLFISSEIIKREGGRIWVNSVEGKGSVFCFALPVRDSSTAADKEINQE